MTLFVDCMHVLARYYIFLFVILCVYFGIIVVFSSCTSSTTCIIKLINSNTSKNAVLKFEF